MILVDWTGEHARWRISPLKVVKQKSDGGGEVGTVNGQLLTRALSHKGVRWGSMGPVYFFLPLELRHTPIEYF